MVVHGRSTVPSARYRPGELRADFSLGLTRRPWLERTAKASGPGDTLRGEVAPIAVVAVRRCWTPRARTCGLSCSTPGPFGCRMPGPTVTGPGPLPGQRVLGTVSEPDAARCKPRVSVVNAPAAQLPGLTGTLPRERPSPDQRCQGGRAWSGPLDVPRRGPRRTEPRVTGVTPPHRTRAEGSHVVPTGIARHLTPGQRGVGPNGQRGRDTGTSWVVARTLRFSGFHSGAAHIMSSDHPIQLRHAGTPITVGSCPENLPRSTTPARLCPNLDAGLGPLQTLRQWRRRITCGLTKSPHD